MKTKTVFALVIALALTVFIATVAVAECPDGKTEVTIENPAGKVMVICVPENVVDNIGGPGDVVIPASCPCFTAADVEETVASGAEYIGQMQVAELEGQSFYIMQLIVGEVWFFVEGYGYDVPGPEAIGKWKTENDGFCPFKFIRSCPKEEKKGTCSDLICTEMSPDEIEACVAILRNVVEWYECVGHGG